MHIFIAQRIDLSVFQEYALYTNRYYYYYYYIVVLVYIIPLSC